MIVTRPLVNADDVAAWARAAGFIDLMPENWHVTVINTRTRIDADTLAADAAELVVPASGNRLVIRMGYEAEFIALAFQSASLAARHMAFRVAGAETDHRQFRSHVTFTINYGRDLTGVTPYAGPLVFRGEVWT